MTEQEREMVLKLIERTERKEIGWENDQVMGGFTATMANSIHLRIHPELREVALDKWEFMGYTAEIETGEGSTGLQLWEEGERTLLSKLYNAAEGAVREHKRQIVLRFTQQTERGQIRWELDGNSQGLYAVVDNASHLNLRPWYREIRGGDMAVGGYKLEILEEHEQQSEIIEDEEALLTRLYETARHSIEQRAIDVLGDHLKDTP